LRAGLDPAPGLSLRSRADCGCNRPGSQSYAVAVEDEHSVEFALYLYRTSGADFADCLGVTNGFLGCTSTATFDQRAAELDEFELIPA
jgi:hypothetical protein